MANLPRNIFLGEISGNALTTISNPPTGETHANLWAVVYNSHSASLSFDIFHGDSGGDLKIDTFTIQSGKSKSLVSLTGVRINSDQILKIQCSDASGLYTVDLNASVVTDDT